MKNFAALATQPTLPKAW